jgi:hypothetical protein
MKIYGVLLKILAGTITHISPEIKKLVKEYYMGLKAQAEKTENPFDDLAVYVLGVVLGLED